MPPAMRATTSIQYSGAIAQASVVTASTRSARRGIRWVRAVRGADVTTTVNANTETSRPTRGSPTRRVALISGMRPVGSISPVIERKTAAERARSPRHGRALAGAAGAEVEVEVGRATARTDSVIGMRFI